MGVRLTCWAVFVEWWVALVAAAVVDCCILSWVLDGGVVAILCIRYSLCNLRDGYRYKENTLPAN